MGNRVQGDKGKKMVEEGFRLTRNLGWVERAIRTSSTETMSRNDEERPKDDCLGPKPGRLLDGQRRLHHCSMRSRGCLMLGKYGVRVTRREIYKSGIGTIALLMVAPGVLSLTGERD